MQQPAPLFHSLRDEADRAFALLDTDRDGLLDVSELCAAVPEAGARAWGLRRIAHLVPRFDGDGDGKLDSGEFAQLLSYLERGLLVHDELEEAWRRVDELEKKESENQRLKLKASGGLVADAPPVPKALRSLHERAEAALGPVRERAEAAKQEAHGAHAKAALPEALRTFTPLAQEPEVKEAATTLAPCEQALVLALSNGSAADAEKTEVRAKVAALARTLADKIAEKTGREDLAPLVKECEAAISAGNVDFQRVYDGVFRVIQSAEAEHLEKYNATVAALRKLLTGEAKQRDEAADPVTLLVDAAQAKPAFDAVVRCLEGATGARLELQTLGPSTTGLKKLSRILEKAQLRPGERRGKTERVCDVVRAMFVCNAMATVALIGEALAALHAAGVIVVSRAARAQRARPWPRAFRPRRWCGSRTASSPRPRPEAGETS